MTRFAFLSVVLLAVTAAACGSEPEPLAGYQRSPAPDVGDVVLPAVEADGSEAPFTFAATDDDVLLVYFGYTSCPDVCPTTLSDLRRALDGVESAERVEVAMVTIDPEVDTPEIVTAYVRSFVPDAVAIRTDDDSQLRSAATAFGADYGIIDPDGEREVFHTGSLYAIDDEGRMVLTWPFGIAADDIARDLDRVLAGEVTADAEAA